MPEASQDDSKVLLLKNFYMKPKEEQFMDHDCYAEHYWKYWKETAAYYSNRELSNKNAFNPLANNKICDWSE